MIVTVNPGNVDGVLNVDVGPTEAEPFGINLLREVSRAMGSVGSM